MALTILDGATAAAVAAAFSQTAQCAALLAPWAGSAVTARVMQGSTLRSTLTHGAWVANAATPRGIVLGSRLARTFIAGGAPDRIVFRAGSTDIFQITADTVAGADYVFASLISLPCRERLDGLVIGANPSLPIVSPDLQLTLDATGTVGTPASGSVHNSGVTAAPFSLAGTGLTVTPPSATVAAGGTVTFSLSAVAAGVKSLVLTNLTGGAANGSPGSITFGLAPTYGPLVQAGVPGTGTVNADATGLTLTNNGTAAVAWHYPAISGLTITPGSGTLAAGASVSITLHPTAAATYTLTPVDDSGGSVVGGGASFVAGVAVSYATTATLSVNATGTTGVASSVTVTLNGAVPIGGITVTLSATNSGTLGTTTLVFAFGGATSQSTTILRSTNGTSAVSISAVTGGLTPNGAENFTSSAAPVSGSMAFTLTSATTQTAPFSLGFAFRPGDIPSGQGITATAATLQATVQNRWPDGSVKFAVLAGSASLVGGTPLAVGLAPGTALAGTALATADLKATGAVATIGCGSFGTVSWATTDWDSPFQTVAAGPQMSSWVYRKPVGSDPHLVAWLEVRLFAGGIVDVLPWLENGYLNVAAPTCKNDLFTFSLGGTTRFSDYVFITRAVASFAGPTFELGEHFDNGGGPCRIRVGSLYGTATYIGYDATTSLQQYGVVWDGAAPSTMTSVQVLGVPSHGRAPLLSGAALSHWLGADPGVAVKHDVAYLQSTKLVPNYAGQVASGASVVTGLAATFVPMQQGNWTYPQDAMPGTGYSEPIGLLPQHDVLYLTANSGTEFGAVMRNCYGVGRYGIHYRDETTNRPLKFSAYPHLSVDSSDTGYYPPGATGASCKVWDVAHHPSVGYLAYLISGRWYALETIQFAATTNYLYQVADSLANLQRNYSEGIFMSSSGASTVRGAAWANRTLAQAATATPDADSLQAEFVASLTANINWNAASYANVSGTAYAAVSNNPYGIVRFYGASGGTYGAAPDGASTDASWQQDFYTAAFGYMLAMNPPISSGTKTNLAAFFAWKAKYAVSKLGDPQSASAWPYIDAAPYATSVSPAGLPDWAGGTGPWFSSARAMYVSTQGITSATVNPVGTDTGTLRGGNFPDATSYWGNLAPAISYAIDAALSGAATIPGAAIAYSRMANASNYGSLTAGYNTDPVWGVKPRQVIATAITATTTGVVGQVATVQVGFSGPFSDPVTVTPAGTGLTFSPTSVTVPANGTAVFTATATADGTHPISFTNNGALGNPAGFSFTTGLPAWVSALPLWQWYSIPNTALSSVAPSPPVGGSASSKIGTWNGATLKSSGSVYMLGAAGGHADYPGNEVDALVLNTATPQWQQLTPPTPAGSVYNDGTQFYADYHPAATHTYYATQFINSMNWMVVMPSPGYVGGVGSASPSGWPYPNASKYLFVFDYGASQWKLPTSSGYPSVYPRNDGDWTACTVCKHPVTEDIYYGRYATPWYKYTASTDTWAVIAPYAPGNDNYAGSAIDSTRNKMLVVGDYSGTYPPKVYDLAGNDQAVTFGGLGAAALQMTGYPGAVYDPIVDCFFVLKNNSDGTTTTLYQVSASTYSVSIPSVTGTPPVYRQNGIENAIQYVPELRGLVIADTYTGNVKFMRTAT